MKDLVYTMKDIYIMVYIMKDLVYTMKDIYIMVYILKDLVYANLMPTTI